METQLKKEEEEILRGRFFFFLNKIYCVVTCHVEGIYLFISIF